LQRRELHGRRRRQRPPQFPCLLVWGWGRHSQTAGGGGLAGLRGVEWSGVRVMRRAPRGDGRRRRGAAMAGGVVASETQLLQKTSLIWI
jgi:hypothetical protein